MKYTLEITSMKASSDAKAVKNVSFKLTATQGKEIAYEHGDADLPEPEKGKEFIPFDKITEAQALTWLTNSIGKVRMDRMKKNLAQTIAERVSPPTVALTPPWVKPEVAPAAKKAKAKK